MHYLSPEDGGIYLALRSAGRQWELPSWVQHYRLTASDWLDFRAAVRAALSDRPLTVLELARVNPRVRGSSPWRPTRLPAALSSAAPAPPQASDIRACSSNRPRVRCETAAEQLAPPACFGADIEGGAGQFNAEGGSNLSGSHFAVAIVDEIETPANPRGHIGVACRPSPGTAVGTWTSLPEDRDLPGGPARGGGTFTDADHHRPAGAGPASSVVSWTGPPPARRRSGTSST